MYARLQEEIRRREMGPGSGRRVVALHVQREMIGAGKGALAERALERLVARVLAVVPAKR